MKKGFSIVEVMLAATLFVIFATGLVIAVLSGLNNNQLAAEQTIANQYATEGLEVARGQGFTNVSNANSAFDKYSRSVVVTTVDSDTKKVVSTVSWNVNSARANSVVLTTYLTSWRATGVVSGNLNVDTSNAYLAVGNKELQGITVENTGSASAVIDKITVTWNNSNLIQNVRIDNTSVWTGNQPSGTELDIQNFTLAQGSGTKPIDKFRFDGNMVSGIFTILFTLADGTTKTVAVDLSSGGGSPKTCSGYCVSLGTYVQGTCRKGASQCNANDETMENNGNHLCTIQEEGGTCCCK